MVLAWENLQEVFVMLVGVVAVFVSLEVFHFITFFISLLSTSSLILPWATASATVLSGCFLPAGFFLTYTPSFVTQIRAWKPHPESSSVPALTKLSLLADAWTLTIDVWITRPLIFKLRQWVTKYRVKIELLNMFLLVQSHM